MEKIIDYDYGKYPHINWDKRYVAFKHKGKMFILDKAVQVGDRFMIYREDTLWGKPGSYATLVWNGERKCTVKSEGKYKLDYHVEADMKFCQHNGGGTVGNIIGYTTDSIESLQQLDPEQISITFAEMHKERHERLIRIKLI